MPVHYDIYQRSLRQLIRQYQHWNNPESHWSVLVEEAIAESVFRRFEVCFDALWKALQHHLTHELGLVAVPHSPKPLFWQACDRGLLPGEISTWLQYADLKSETSHDYTQAKAVLCMEEIPAFIRDAQALYERLTQESWS